MEPKITPKQENIPSFDSNAVAVKHIEYYPYGGTYNEDKITLLEQFQFTELLYLRC